MVSDSSNSPSDPSASQLRDFLGRFRHLAEQWSQIRTGQFKERFGLTRKWAIPFLEHLDSTGATRRLGSERQVVRRG